MHQGGLVEIEIETVLAPVWLLETSVLGWCGKDSDKLQLDVSPFYWIHHYLNCSTLPEEVAVDAFTFSVIIDFFSVCAATAVV